MSAEISPQAFIGKNVTLGEGVVIHPFAYVNDNVTIGNNVEIFPYAYVGKEPKGAGATARKIVFEKSVVIGDNCTIGPHSTIYYDVTIGNNTMIGDNASIREQCRIGSFTLICRSVTLNYNAHIGDHTKILDLTHITGNCRIGSHVFFGPLIATTNDNQFGKEGYDEAKIVGPTVEDYATIGAGASLLSAVRIGRGAIVGSNAVVTKDIPAYKVAFGIPAKVIKDAPQLETINEN